MPVTVSERWGVYPVTTAAIVRRGFLVFNVEGCFAPSDTPNLIARWVAVAASGGADVNVVGLRAHSAPFYAPTWVVADMDDMGGEGRISMRGPSTVGTRGCPSSTEI